MPRFCFLMELRVVHTHHRWCGDAVFIKLSLHDPEIITVIAEQFVDFGL
jgi:hypothetical protein